MNLQTLLSLPEIFQRKQPLPIVLTVNLTNHHLLISLSQMDVMNVEQAKIAEAAGAVAVMALERIPADIRRDGGVARMSDPAMILEIKNAVTIPVMAKARIGHFVEAQILEACEIDYIDESEVLTMADEVNHIDKTQFNVPFVCGCRNIGEALRRCAEGAAMLRTKGEAGTGNIVEAVRHARTVQSDIKRLSCMTKDELFVAAKNLQAPYELVKYVADNGRLPVVNFAAGGVATPADAALMMQLGMDGVFVGSGIFKSANPEARAKAIVKAVTHYKDPKILMECSTGLGPAMVGISDIRGDPVNFRDREGGESNPDGVPPKKVLHGATETKLYGSSWN
jgi:pyridoxal 5'-phosphate synthase pdxS subunit